MSEDDHTDVERDRERDIVKHIQPRSEEGLTFGQTESRMAFRLFELLFFLTVYD